MNLTDMHNMLMHMSEELRETKQEHEATKQRQLATEKELNATREILNIGNVMIPKIEVGIRTIWTQLNELIFLVDQYSTNIAEGPQ